MARLARLAAVMSVSMAAACGVDATPDPRGDATPDPAAPRTGPADVVRGDPMAGRFLYPARLGQGRDTLSGADLNGCVTAPVVAEAADDLWRRLEHPLGAADLARLAGAEVGSPESTRPKVEGLSGLARVNPLSSVFAYGAVARTGVERLDLTQLSPWGSLVPGTADWSLHCGDALRAGQTLGSAVVLAFRFDFVDLAAKARFDAAVGTDVAAWDLWPRLEAYLASPGAAAVFSGGFHAWQVGGDPVSLGSRLGADALSGCGLHVGLASCATLTDRLVAWVSAEGPGSFTAEAAATPGWLGVELVPWSDVLAVAPPEIPASLTLSLDRLYQLWEENQRVEDRLWAMDRLPVSLDTMARLGGLQRAALANEAALQYLLGTCHAVLSPGLTAEGVDRCAAGATDAGLAASGYDPALTLEAVLLLP